MESLNLSLGQNFNKTHNEVVNCEIVRAPHYPGRVPHTFFLRKRKGLVSAFDDGFDETYDTVTIGSARYSIGKIGPNVSVKKNGTQLFSSSWVAGRAYKFFFMNTCSSLATPAYDGSARGISGSAAVLTDTATPGWTVNAYAGKYVYVYEANSGGSGSGQVFPIKGNTATALDISDVGFQYTVPTNCKFYIFDFFRDTLAFVGGDGIYCLHTDANIIKVPGTNNAVDCVYRKGKLFFVDTNYVIYAGVGYLYFGFHQTQASIVGSAYGCFNMVEFQDYLLLLGNNFIKLLKETQVIVSNTTSVQFTVQPVIESFGAFQQGSFRVYNQGFYMFTNNRQFMSVSITAVASDKYVVQETNQGLYAQKYFDLVSVLDTVRITIDDQGIWIVHRDGTGAGGAVIHVFDIVYQGWHRWVTKLAISKVDLRTGEKLFLGSKIFRQETAAVPVRKDDGTYLFDQVISLVIGEDTVHALKRNIFTKLYLSKNSTRGTFARYYNSAGGRNWNFDVKLLQAGYLNLAAAYSSVGNTLGSMILGSAALAGAEVVETVSDTGIIEIGTGFWYSLAILEYRAEGEEYLEYGGTMVGFDRLQDQINPYTNVV
jgi:hypothetical protein